MTIYSKDDYRFYLRADLKARGKDTLTLRDRMHNWNLKYQRMLRKMEFYINKDKSTLDKICYRILEYRFNRLSALLGISIPPNTCGAGLLIVHYGSIVISGKAKLGKDCRIHSCVNIGEQDGKAPVLGDKVYIGPGAKLYGDITIGDGVVIGANAVVNKSFPSNVTIAGFPAQIVSKKNSDHMIPRIGTILASKEG